MVILLLPSNEMGAEIVYGDALTAAVTGAAACVIVTFCAVAYVAETVTTAERVTLRGFAAAFTVIVALFEPDVLLTVNHV